MTHLILELTLVWAFQRYQKWSSIRVLNAASSYTLFIVADGRNTGDIKASTSVPQSKNRFRVSDTEMPPRCPFRRLGSSNRSQTKFCRDSSRAPSAVRTLARPAAGTAQKAASRGPRRRKLPFETPPTRALDIRQQREHQRRRSQPRRAGEPLCCRGKTRNGGSAR